MKIKPMRLVIALGGNALLRRHEPMTADHQRTNIRIAVEQIARIAGGRQLLLTHGNGPQIGLLSLQAAAYPQVSPYPLDVLGAETEGMIGYMIEQELRNLLPADVSFATVLTQVEVDGKDSAFHHPTKPIGPLYSQTEADELALEKGWKMAPDGDQFRRVVASPKPKRILEIQPIEWLLNKGCIVICAGGGGIPTRYTQQGRLVGVEAVIDKDLCSALLAEQLNCDLLVIATDVKGVFTDWNQPAQRLIRQAHPAAIAQLSFAEGSMAPKVQAACDFALRTGKVAVIGSLADIEGIVQGKLGTRISIEKPGICFESQNSPPE